MNYRDLGRTGIKVSEIGFGCGNVGGLMIRGDPKDRVRAVARAMELGINYFDTAPSYGDGQSERNLGLVLKKLRPQVHVGTKVRLEPQDMADIRGGVIRSVEDSLGRLGRDSVDLIQLHNRIAAQRQAAQDFLSTDDVLAEVVEAFQALRSQGKVRFYGITGGGETSALHQVIASGALYTVQAFYNLLNPSAGAGVPPGFPAQDFCRLVDKAAENGMGVLAIRVLAAGALSGVAERNPVAVTTVSPMGSGRDYREDVDRAGRFSFLVREGHVADLVEAALRFVLGKQEVSTVLVGYSSLEHLEKAVAAASRGPLPEEVVSRLTAVWAGFAER
jgi:aryl-alcohol dehydrogenase-like predicted oxidoreductase